MVAGGFVGGGWWRCWWWLVACVQRSEMITTDCRRGLQESLGTELFESQWNRLTSPMREWAARVLYFLPITP